MKAIVQHAYGSSDVLAGWGRDLNAKASHR
jgi:hypothetical protein